MTSFRLSELPTPCTSAGFPAGCTLAEGGPTPPTAKTYFSGTNNNMVEQGGMYAYVFDPSTGEYAHDFYDKQVDDELSVTINGTAQTLSITGRESGEGDSEVFADFDIRQPGEDFPLVKVNVFAYVGEDDWTFGSFSYISPEEIPGGVTLVIADPS